MIFYVLDMQADLFLNKRRNKMAKRQSIYIAGFPHANPTPAACRIGQMLYSAVVYGRDPETQLVPPEIDRQVALMFEHVRNIVEAAGGSMDDIIKFTLWMQDKSQREVVNRHWERLFPDRETRPARHTLDGNFSGNTLIQCDFVAVISE